MRSLRLVSETGMLAVALALALVAGCGGDRNGAAMSSPTSAEPIPTITQLHAALLTPSELAGDFETEFEGTRGGVIEPCVAASRTSMDAAGALVFQVGIILRQEGNAPGAETGAVYVQQYLLAGDPGAVAATFAALRAGAEACYGEPLVPEEDYGTNDPYALPAVGDERYGEYHVMGSDTPGYGSYLHMAVVRDGPILMLVDVWEYIGQEGQSTVVTSEDVGAIVTTAVAKLP